MTRKDGRPRSVSAATTDPRAYGVVLSSASATAGDLIATYAPTYGAAVDAAVEEDEMNHWPKLAEPVSMCDSCEHDARRSGWEPGR